MNSIPECFGRIFFEPNRDILVSYYDISDKVCYTCPFKKGCEKCTKAQIKNRNNYKNNIKLITQKYKELVSKEE